MVSFRTICITTLGFYLDNVLPRSCLSLAVRRKSLSNYPPAIPAVTSLYLDRGRVSLLDHDAVHRAAADGLDGSLEWLEASQRRLGIERTDDS